MFIIDKQSELKLDYVRLPISKGHTQGRKEWELGMPPTFFVFVLLSDY